MARTGITPTRDKDFAEWYQQVIKAADLADNSVVRGCMVIKPYAYAIWENIQRIFDGRLKRMGVQNAYFPLLIPVSFLAKEAKHVEGFAKECAVVTHSRLRAGEDGGLVPDGQLQEPYVIRPTSEAIIGNSISGWINTYRDLPMKLNQWCNVMRWEMRPRLFLRTSEFLWQEGHTIFASAQEAHDDAETMLASYHKLLSEDLCLHPISGEKTAEERFPGAVNTYTLEVMTQDGKALQGATSHYLGQSFSKAFDIGFTGSDGLRHNAYTSSWGISTRLIGAIIMSHGDDDGLVLPPDIAPYHVVIVPISSSDNAEVVDDYCRQLLQKLEIMDIRVLVDNSESTGSSRNWKWIKKGAPIILMIGGKEQAEGVMTVLRRDEVGQRKTISLEQISEIPMILGDISSVLRHRSKDFTQSHIKTVENIAELDALFNNHFSGFAKMRFDSTLGDDFTAICKRHALTRRCRPHLEEDYVLLAKSY